jgi:hypothetical protein
LRFLRCRFTIRAATPGQCKGIKALDFDAYGTLFDVFSVTALREQLFSRKGTQLALTWRMRQMQHSLCAARWVAIATSGV